MNSDYTSEAIIKNPLIDQLTNGEGQKAYQKDLNTDSLLWRDSMTNEKYNYKVKKWH